MDEITISIKALVHIVGLILSIAITIILHICSEEKKGVLLILGLIVLLAYFLFMPESYLNEAVFRQ